MYQRGYQMMPQQGLAQPGQTYQGNSANPQLQQQQQYMIVNQMGSNGVANMNYEIKGAQQQSLRGTYQNQTQNLHSPNIVSTQPYQINGNFPSKASPSYPQTQNIGGAVPQNNNVLPQGMPNMQGYNNISSNQNSVITTGVSSMQSSALSNSRVLSPERRVEEIDMNLQHENEKYNRQFTQLESLLEAFRSFELSKNPAELKRFNQKESIYKMIFWVHQQIDQNQQIFSELIDEIYETKARIEDEKKRGDELRVQSAELKQQSLIPQMENQNSHVVSGPLLSLQNAELQKKLDQLKEEQNRIRQKFTDLDSRKNQQDYYDETREQLDYQIQNLEETEKQIETEVNMLVASNQKLYDQLSKKDFFKEYDFMCREKKGLTDQNERMVQDIKAKDEELNKLKGKQEAPFPQCGMAPVQRP